MAKVIGNVPERDKSAYGEYIFHKALLEYLPDEVSVSFNLNLAGAHEMDVVLAHPSLGNFLIEVKGHSISQLDSRSNSGFKVNVTPTSLVQRIIDPVGQVRNQMFSFIQYFHARGVKSPYFFVAVAFPQISRSEWEAKFNCLDGEENFIFSDDLVSMESLTRALTLNQKNPIQGVFPGEKIALNFIERQNLISAMNKQLSKPKIRSFESIKNLNFIDIEIEKQFTEKENAKKLLKITGDAGTGKTYKLIQWANKQATQGKRVLVTTFNNSLTAELRRLNSISFEGVITEGSVSILSFSELLIEVAQRLNFKLIPFSDYRNKEEWIQRYEELTSTEQELHANEIYDAIAIDEAQDIYNHVWDFLLAKTSSENTEWAMSFSKGQNLYIADEEQANLRVMQWVRSQPENRVTSIHLTKPRRTISEASIIVQAIQNTKQKWSSETYWNSLKIARHNFWTELSEHVGKENLAEIIDENRTHLVSHEDTTFTVSWKEVVDRMIENIEILGNDAAEMVLFASRNDSMREIIKNYLQQRNVKYVDYISTPMDFKHDFDRRLPLPPNFMRLSTIHQARGIDASNVLVFGLDHDLFDVIDGRKNREAISYRLNLWYIALTRARKSTYIEADLTEIQTEYMEAPELVHNPALGGLNDEIMNLILAHVDYRKE